jgi:cellulase/cellobiase CelA1
MVFDELCVLANGDLVCSCGDPAGLRVYGNVHSDRIADIYNGPLYQEIRNWQLQSKPDSWCPVVVRCAADEFHAPRLSMDRLAGP